MGRLPYPPPVAFSFHARIPQDTLYDHRSKSPASEFPAAREAGDSIKPGVERSGTPGPVEMLLQARA